MRTPLPADFLPCASLLQALSDPTLLVDADRRIVTANAAARDLFAVPLVGGLILSYIRQPEAAAAVEQGLQAVAEGKSIEPIEARMLHATASQDTVLQVRISPLAPDLGLRAMMVTLRDISQVEEAEQQRRDFVANVSHELRSPLTVLTGFIETLRGPARDDPEARQQFLDIMDREAQRMTRLVSDLLSLSRVEAEERVRPRQLVSLTDILTAVLAALSHQLDEAELRVTVDAPPALPLIPGDRDQLMQVFHNLIENAVKYGVSGGKIDVSLSNIGPVPGLAGEALCVEVRDYGDGIAPIHVPRLTERFYRIDGHRSRAMGGTGLGLAIVKHIVNRHRGRFTIRSKQGEGSTFTILLPTA